jgi:hypothetical protein
MDLIQIPNDGGKRVHIPGIPMLIRIHSRDTGGDPDRLTPWVCTMPSSSNSSRAIDPLIRAMTFPDLRRSIKVLS